MKVEYKELQRKKNLVIWGVGKTLERYIKQIDPMLDVVCLCDSDINKSGKKYFKGLMCFSKDILEKKHTVIIAIQHPKALEEVIQELEEKELDYCHITDAVMGYKEEWEKKEIVKYEEKWNEKQEYPLHVVKYINCHVPYKFCNLKCEYCYVRQVRDFEQAKLDLYSPEFIRRAFSKERLGGRSFITFCAGGETLLVEELLPIIAELVKEGHYIHIVTNGTVTKAFKKLLSLKIDLHHLFIKFSFHYLELLRTNLLDTYFENIKMMREAGCSITVELVPSDNLVPHIEEIKKISLENLGALPHLTIPRDDREKNLKVLTEYDLVEYKKIWDQFDSKMFSFKYDNLYIQRFENCMAGKWSMWVNLESGQILKCLSNPYIDNIYEDISRELKLEKVGNKCTLPYCYNCHAYLAFGLVEELNAPTYYEVRDRKMLNGEHWITEELKDVVSQKLYDVNRGKE